MRKSRQAMLIGAAALLALAAFSSSPPRADIRILAHQSGDRTPQRMQAAIDVGIFAVSVLITWSKRLAR
jgi:hypothetical protein